MQLSKMVQLGDCTCTLLHNLSIDQGSIGSAWVRGLLTGDNRRTALHGHRRRGTLLYRIMCACTVELAIAGGDQLMHTVQRLT